MPCIRATRASVIEQTAIAGALNPEVLANPENAEQAAHYVARRLDVISEETERGWVGKPEADGGLNFSREVRGVKESWTIDGRLIASADALRLDKKAVHLQEIYAKSGKLRRKDERDPHSRPARASADGLRRRPQRHHAAALQGSRRNEPGAAVGDDARRQCPLAAQGAGARSSTRPTICSPSSWATSSSRGATSFAKMPCRSPISTFDDRLPLPAGRLAWSGS